MAALDGALKSLMQGVSQQVPRERLDGQVSLQSNMLSDVVNGMRRRPGARYLADLNMLASSKDDCLFSTYVDIGDAVSHVLINTETGRLLVTSEDFSTEQHNVVYPYLVGSNAGAIQTSSLRGHLYIANTEQAPVAVHGANPYQDPNLTGFFFVKTGAFSKVYDVTVSNGVSSWTIQYTAPAGQGGNDAALTAPTYIAQQMAQSINDLTGGGVVATRFESYVYVRTLQGPCSVTSNSGSTYLGWSNNSRVALVTDLPARLPDIGDGTMCAVGTVDRNFVWYEYDKTTAVWIEVGAYGSPTGFTGMPIRMSLDGEYTVETPVYEGRLSGSDVTNEDPAFLTNGITGLGSFQGRLVILAGPEVCMSAAGNPLRWYRSTVTSLLSDDPIGIFSGAATSTNFRHCAQFNKDLLLFSRSCQAVVPSGAAAITPSTAQIVITSQYTTDTLAQPGIIGRSILYSMPRTEAFGGILELIPSNTTDSQYTSNDISAHIPRYLPGRVRSITASTTTNSSLFLCTGDSHSVFIQDYLWSGDEKVQSAWHQWTLPYPVMCVWFVRDRVYLGLRDGTQLTVVTIEPQAGNTLDSYIRPFSDVYSQVQIESGTFVVPERLRDAVLAGSKLFITFADTSMGGMWVGYESINTTTWVVQTVRNVPDGQYFVGLRYLSALSPTPPLMRDQNGLVIGTSSYMLVRYELTMKDSGAFDVYIQDNSRVLTSGEYSGLLYSSAQLVPNKPTVETLGRVLIPVRALSQNTVSTFSCDGDSDMCVLDVEYVTQYRARRKRA